VSSKNGFEWKCQKTMVAKETYPLVPGQRNELANARPEALDTLAVRQAAARTNPRAIHDLAHPLVAESVHGVDAKRHPRAEAGSENIKLENKS
jgi:hypothetical protein